jgi:hypothetical protein
MHMSEEQEESIEAVAPPDATALVRQMVDAGEWPEPRLMDQIVAAGESAVEPLLEVLATRPRGWPDEASVCHAATLLAAIRPTAAIPALAAVARFYKNETTEDAGTALAAFGQEGFENLLELIRDPKIVGYQRTRLIECAKAAAGDDAVRRARLGEALRELFARDVTRAREENERRSAHRQTAPIEPHDTAAGEDRAEGDDEYNATQPDEDLAFLVGNLSDLADPLAREMIQSAFDEALIDTEIIGERDFHEDYERGGGPPPPMTDLLDSYRKAYEENRQREARLASLPPVEFPTRDSYPRFDQYERPQPAAAAALNPVAPIRNAAAKIGRNDPCWCGSGKKYKKCHLGKDQPD